MMPYAGNDMLKQAVNDLPFGGWHRKTCCQCGCSNFRFSETETTASVMSVTVCHVSIRQNDCEEPELLELELEFVVFRRNARKSQELTGSKPSYSVPNPTREERYIYRDRTKAEPLIPFRYWFLVVNAFVSL